MFARADSLVDNKFLFCPRFKLSNSVADINIAWCRNGSVVVRLFSKVATKTRKSSRHLFHPTWRQLIISNSGFESECQETGFLSECERQKLQKLYTQSVAAYGSVSKLSKPSIPPVSQMKQFFYPKTWSTKNFLALQKVGFFLATLLIYIQHTQLKMNRMSLSVVCFISKNSSKSLNNGIV